MTEKLTKAKRLLKDAQAIVVLTGAGVSAESGLRTFRDSGGLWDDHAIEDVATPEGFARDPELVWRFYNARRKAADIATPNPGHIALARMESLRLHRSKMKPSATNGHANGNGHGKPSAPVPPVLILTQNIDGLHQQAGSQNVVELHGSIWQVRCTGCRQVTTEHPIELTILPRCELCDKLLRPHVVWFGENLDPEVLAQAELAVRRCDAMLVVGTSGVVQPAAAYPWAAARRGVPVVEINLEETALTPLAAVTLIGKAGELLPSLVAL